MSVIEKLNNECVFGSKTWFNIGVQLYELFDKSEEGLNLWIKYSETDQENYENKTCKVMWPAFYEFFPNGSRDEDTPYILDDAFEMFTEYRNGTVTLKCSVTVNKVTITPHPTGPYIYVSNYDNELLEDESDDEFDDDDKDMLEWLLNQPKRSEAETEAAKVASKIKGIAEQAEYIAKYGEEFSDDYSSDVE